MCVHVIPVQHHVQARCVFQRERAVLLNLECLRGGKHGGFPLFSSGVCVCGISKLHSTPLPKTSEVLELKSSVVGWCCTLEFYSPS